ncbi:MAG: cell division protease FtsH [Actinomycetota bacterium]
MKRVMRGAGVYVVVALIALLVLTTVFQGGPSRKKLTLSTFEAEVAAKSVKSVEVIDGSGKAQGVLRSGQKFEVKFPNEYTDELTTKLLAANVDLESKATKSNALLNFILGVLPFLLIIGLFVFLLNSMQGGGNRVMQFGKAKAKQVSKDSPKITFADVAGADEAVAELQEIKEFLEAPAKFQAMGAKIPKGVLLFGPPGTGKTLLAKAVAGEAGVPFFSISGSDFVEMFVGVGASRVRDLFEQAKASAPAIVFVDEIDAVGRHRGAGLGGGHDEREQTLNQLLVEMDGFESKTGVILIAATNRPDILDPALLRPGRFDRQIVVDAPDLVGREAILTVHSQDKPLTAGVDLNVLARRTPGFTGADLANLMNEAALLAARHGSKRIGMPELEEAIDRVIGGPERKTRVMSESEKLVIAYHEGGHTLVGHVLEHADPVHKVSIVARGRSLGWTLSLPTEDRYITTRSQLRHRLATLMGGRTAEELIFSEPTTGAQNDIEVASGIARSMVTEWGMSDVLGPQQLGQNGGEVFLGRDIGHTKNYSEEVAARVDAEIRLLIDTAHAEARDILSTHRADLDALAKALMEKETLEGDDLAAILGKVGTWKPRQPAAKRKSGPKPGSPAAIPVGGAKRRRQPADAPVPGALRRPRPATA